jgi:hypothetical protein
MSQVTTGVFGVIAVSLALGAAQFASGRDLPSSFQDRLLGLSGMPEAAVNRAAKADRAAVMGSAVQTRTISLRLDGLADTSIVVRIPVAKDVNHNAGDKEAGKEANNNSLPSLTKPGDRKAKMTLACEPVVSSLVEIARQLQPGRCVT